MNHYDADKYMKIFNMNSSKRWESLRIMWLFCTNLVCFVSLHMNTIWRKSFHEPLSHSAICPQLGGRAPVGSSAAVTGPASQESTDVTVCLTARMALTRETAVSLLLHGGFPFFFFYLLWHFNQFVKIKRLADWQNGPQYASCCQRLIADSLVD